MPILKQVLTKEYDEIDFESQLAQAIHNAESEWEKGFVDDLHRRYVKYNTSMFITDKALAKLLQLQTKKSEVSK